MTELIVNPFEMTIDKQPTNLYEPINDTGTVVQIIDLETSLNNQNGDQRLH